MIVTCARRLEDVCACTQHWDVLVPCCAVVPIVEKVRGLIKNALSQGLSHRPSSSSLSGVAKDLLNGQRLLVVCIVHIFNAAALELLFRFSSGLGTLKIFL